MKNNELIAAVLIILIIMVGLYFVVDKIYQPKQDTSSNPAPSQTNSPIIASEQTTITTNPTSVWKNADILGYSKYENQTYNFRIQYPSNANTVMNFMNSDGFETYQYGNMIFFVWIPREPNDIQNTLFRYRQYAWVALQNSNMNPISPPQNFVFSQDSTYIDGVPAIRVTFPKLNVVQLGIQTTDWCYWIQYHSDNQSEIKTINSFEFINTPSLPSTVTITPTTTDFSSQTSNYDLSGNCADLARKSLDTRQNCGVYGRNDPHCDWNYVTALSDKMAQRRCGQTDAYGNIIL